MDLHNSCEIFILSYETNMTGQAGFFKIDRLNVIQQFLCKYSNIFTAKCNHMIVFFISTHRESPHEEEM